MNKIFFLIFNHIFENLKDSYEDKYEYIIPDVTLNKNLFNDKYGSGEFNSNSRWEILILIKQKNWLMI